MAYPDKPQILTSYTAEEQSIGNGTLPGQELDVDFAALQASVEQVIDFVKLFTRSDGQLANGIVTTEALAASVRIGFDPPEVWASGQEYTTRSTVFSGFGFYLCTVAHTSGADFAIDLAAGRWQELANLTPPGGALIATNNLSDLTNAAAARASLGLGDVATDSIVPVSRGGTGGTDAAAARSNLGLVIGTDVQAYDADLAAVAGLSSTGIVVRTGAGTATVRSLANGTFVTVTNGSGVSGNPTIDIPASAIRASSEGTATLLDTELPTALWVQEAIRSLTLVRGTQISTASGSTVEALSLPSWIRRITLNFRGVSTTGTAVPFLQLGTSGGYVTTGYAGSAVAVIGGAGLQGGAGLPIYGETASVASNHGNIVITRAEGNVWTFSGTISRADAIQVNVMAGSVDLGGTLDRLRLIITGGQTFDSGFINLVTE